MSARRNSRQAVGRRATAARRFTPYSLYRRALRIEPLEDRRLLAVVTVNTLSDTTNLNDNLTTLREAIFATNTVPGADFIDFAPSAVLDGQSKIVLTQGALRITDSVTIDWPNAGALTIDASGSDPTPNVKNGDGSRAFNIAAGSGNVKLSYLSITGADNGGDGGAIFNAANLTISDCEIFGNSARDGGAVYTTSGSLVISTSVISNNRATSSGGGVFARGALTVVESAISGNSAFTGGGLRILSREATIIDSLIDHNTAPGGGGGGIAVGPPSSGSGHTTITRSTIDHNSAGLGGGIDGENVTVDSSTISNNTAGKGAGIYHVRGSLQINNSTISGNQSVGEGGGGAIYNFRGGATISFSTITQNTNGLVDVSTNDATYRLFSTIVAGNLGSDLQQDDNKPNAFQSDGFNIVGTGNGIGAFSKPGDQIGVSNPLLGPLADNGGPTFTHALLPGSPAINAGDLNAVAGVNGVPQFDQRSTPFGRVFNGRIDIGAFEYQEASNLNLLVDTLADENDGNYARGDLSLREAIALANMWPSADTINFAPALTAGGPATIVLTQGELKITDSLTINGPGANLLTIDASGSDPTPTVVNGDGSRVFNIDDGAATASIVSISGLTLTGGQIATDGGAVFTRESLALVDMVVDKNYSTSLTGAGAGGGIAAVLRDGATLEVTRSQINNNQSTSRGGGISLDIGTGASAIISGTEIKSNSKRNLSSLGSTFAGGGICIINSGGMVTIDDSVITGNASDGNGGGISFDGALTIQDSRVSNNSAFSFGGGIHFRASTGGGLSLLDSDVTDNEAGGGGGIALSGSNTSASTIARSQIARNSVERRGIPIPGHGGGIYFDQGAIHIADSTILDNNAETDGGGIYTTNIGAFPSSFLIERSTIAFNSAFANGGGLNLGRGGTIRSSTITGNTARTGGAVYARGTVAMPTNIEHSTIVGNEASNTVGGAYVAIGPLNLNHSIVALNTSPAAADDISRGSSGLVTATWSLIGNSNGSGLAEAPVGSPSANGNLIGGSLHGLIDPLFRTLADYGGPTPTFALSAGSPAINAGNLAAVAGVGSVPLFDQRGLPFSRVIDGRIDIGSFEFHAPPVVTTLIVDTLVDESDGNCAVGDLSLREALQLANLDADANTIQFSPALTAGGAATIFLTRGALEIVGAVTIVGPGANLLTIDANGSDPTPDVNDGLGSSIFEIGDNTDDLFDVAISGLMLVGGDSQYGGAILSTENLTITGSLITGNHAAQLGGGLAVLYGSVEITDCVIGENSTDGTGGGIAASGAEVVIEDCEINSNVAAVGGGIHAYDTLLSISDCTIDGNEAIGVGGAGGGIYSKDGELSVVDSTVSGNTSISGGGIYNDGEAEIVRTTLDGNYSYLHGGGLYSFGKLTVRETTISGSSTGLDGAGIHASGDVVIDSSTLTANDAGRYGGAIWVEVVDGTLTIVNSTISGNHADNEGGGVWITGTEATATIAHSTIVENTANHLFGFGGGVVLNSGSLQLDHTIVATNSAKTGPDLFTQAGTQLAAEYSLIGSAQDTNLIESPVGLPDANGNLVGGVTHGVIDPLLGPLTNNGGLTPTHALLPGSPAINAGNLNATAGLNGVPQFDQRGTPFGRVGRVDIGAFEYQQTSNLVLVVDTLVDENDGNYSDGDLSLREAIALADVWPDDDTIHFDPELIASGPAAILLTRGELKITTSMSIFGLGADLLTIDASGNDPTPTIKDGLGSRVVAISQIDFYVDCFLAGLTLTGGDVTSNGGAIQKKSGRLILEDMTITGNASLASGGGISSDRSDLTVLRSKVTNNLAEKAAAGILCSSSSLVISDSTISGNVVLSDKGIGGGIYFSDYSAGNGRKFEITNSTIAGNIAPLVGGGIAARSANGISRIVNSDISGNTSLSDLGPRGAGIYLFGNGTTTIESSNIHHNSVNSIGRGGGIFSAVNLRVNKSTIASNFGGVDGGGIQSVGNLWLTDCIVTQNATVNSAGGGGISMTSLYGVQVAGTTISNNQGSGIRQTVGSISIFTSLISGNSTTGSGGGIYTGDTVTNIFVSQSEIRDNHAAGSGGGIYKAGGELVVVDSTIASNTAGANGGGVASLANQDSYTSSTISGNEAVINGGGVWANASQTFAYSTIALNKAGGAGGGAFLANGNSVAKSTILARNTASAGVDVTGLLGAQFEARSSLIGSNQGSGLAPAPIGSPDSNGNLIGGSNANNLIDPNLAALANNGGLTRTHLPLAGSPAINAGDALAFGAPVSDQRGVKFNRVVGGRIDIGAVEVQPAPLVGDYNFNGIVDSADFIVWRNTVGTTGNLAADGNDDGRVDNADYQLWRANFGNTRPVVGSGSVEVAQSIVTTVASMPSSVAAEPVVRESRSAPIMARQVGPQLVASPDVKHQRAVTPAETASERRAGGLLAWLAAREDQSVPQESADDQRALNRASDDCAEPDSKSEAVDEAFATLLDAAW